jgi:DNA polymerase III delta prime subunit
LGEGYAAASEPGALARDHMMPEFIFDREGEKQSIRQRLAKRRPFLIHGPTAVGKTLLLRSLLPEFPSVLYCEDSSTTHIVFRSLARSLLRLGSPRARTAFRSEEAIKTKSAVSLKGIVMAALTEGQYTIVLDHLAHPSHSFAAAVREIMSWGSTPVSAVARSSHMEDTGFLQPLYSDRSEKYEIRNFEKSVAEQFAREVVRRTNLTASNMNEFLDKILQFSEGNPGAIVALVETAKHPKYRSEEHIKISPLYIDFRMNWRVAG